MSQSELIAVQVFLILAGPLLAILFLVRAVRAGRAAARERFEAISAEAVALGLHIQPGSTLLKYRALANVDGVIVSVEPVVQTEHGHRGRTIERWRSQVSAQAPCTWADAAVMRDAPQFFGLGHLTEVRFEPWFPYRTFAVAPEQVHTWLGPGTRAALARGTPIESVTVQSSRMTMLLGGLCTSANELANAAAVVAAMHRGVAPPPPSNAPASPGRLIHSALLCTLGALLLGGLLAVLAPLIPVVPSVLSPLICESGGEAELRTYARRGRRLTYGCVYAHHAEEAGGLAHPAMVSLVGTVSFLGAYGLMSLLVRSHVQAQLSRQRGDS